MLWKSFYKLRIPLLIEVIARLCIRFLQVHFHWCIADSASEVLPKNQPRYMRGVCVYHLNRCKTSYWFSLICRGAVNLIPSTAQRRRWFEIVISGLIIPTYLRLYFSDIARGQAKNPNHNLIQFAALLSQSGITFGHLLLIQLHQNLPQSKDVESTYVLFCLHDRRQHRRRWYSSKFRRRYSSPMVLLLVYSFFLTSILNPMTILKYFYYS